MLNRNWSSHTRHGLFLFFVTVSALVLIGCDSEKDQYLTEMADWHNQWNKVLHDEFAKEALLNDLQDIKFVGTGTEALRHERYIFAHELDVKASRLSSALWEYEAEDYPPFCASAYAYAGWEGPTKLGPAPIAYEPEWQALPGISDWLTACHMDVMASQLLTNVRVTAELGWLKNHLR